MVRIRHAGDYGSALCRYKRGGRSVCAVVGSRCQSERDSDVYAGRETQDRKGSQAKEERDRVALYTTARDPISLPKPLRKWGLSLTRKCPCKATGSDLSVS